MASGSYRLLPVPDLRVPQIELMPALALRNPMHGLLEVDITVARQRLREHRQATGERLSFTAFVIHCLATAVQEHREVQGFRRGRRVIVFDEVDVATLVEVEAGGMRVPLPLVIRDAAHRPVRAVNEEIRAAQKNDTLASELRKKMRWVARVPRPLRWLMWRALARSPRLRKRFGGTVVVTSVGSTGTGRAFGVGVVSYPVTLTVGGITTQPGVEEGQLQERERLCLTVSLDHEVVDGAPAARFIQRLRQLLEGAHGL